MNTKPDPALFDDVFPVEIDKSGVIALSSAILTRATYEWRTWRNRVGNGHRGKKHPLVLLIQNLKVKEIYDDGTEKIVKKAFDTPRDELMDFFFSDWCAELCDAMSIDHAWYLGKIGLCLHCKIRCTSTKDRGDAAYKCPECGRVTIIKGKRRFA